MIDISYVPHITYNVYNTLVSIIKIMLDKIDIPKIVN